MSDQLRPIDFNTYLAADAGESPASPPANPADDLVQHAARALFEFGRLQGRLEAALARIAELEEQVKDR